MFPKHSPTVPYNNEIGGWVALGGLRGCRQPSSETTTAQNPRPKHLKNLSQAGEGAVNESLPSINSHFQE